MAKQVEERSSVLAEDVSLVSYPKDLVELREFVLDKLNTPQPNIRLIWQKLEDVDKLVGSMIMMNKIDIDSTTESEYAKVAARINNDFIRANQYGSPQHIKAAERAKEEIKRVHDHYHAMSDNVMAFKFLLRDTERELILLQRSEAAFLQIGLETLKTIDALNIVPDPLIDATPLQSEEQTQMLIAQKEETSQLVISEPLDLGSLSLASNVGEEVLVEVLGGYEDVLVHYE